MYSNFQSPLKMERHSSISKPMTSRSLRMGQAIGRRLDALAVRAVPGVCKVVKWNSPFYGVKEGEWFLSFHCFTRYVKVTFFRGTSLSPVPPGTSKHPEVRYWDITEDGLDEKQFTAWVKQAAALPGERM